PLSYVRSRIELREASGPDGPATVKARARETRLDRFRYRQLWTRGKNGRRRAAGIAVQVKRGRPMQTLKGAFLVPLKRGREAGAGGMAIALRPKGSKRAYEVLYSSSVRDLLKDQVENKGLGAEIAAYYEQQIALEAQRSIARARA
ncbi:MAG TPA: hypothetical protein VHE37_09025, partial [Nevskiaceae bacterium]|nr:hypothetical protein [Nevskiaceae bacterium]